MNSEQQPDFTKLYQYSTKLSTDQKCIKIDMHYYHELNNDITYDIANQMVVDAYIDLRARLVREGFNVAPIPDKKE